MVAIADPRASYSESALSALWGRAHTLADGLLTEDGKRLQVIYPGRPNARAGPDFRDAVLLDSEGKTVTGDIELHTNAPNWYSHGHHSDPNYNGVVLHVVFSPKGSAYTQQHSGMQAPIASLEAVAHRLDKADSHQSPTLPALDELRISANIALDLESAGDARFLAKSRGFTMDIRHTGAEEALYRATFDALGYASNRKPFRTLAQRLPYSELALLRDEPPATRLIAIKAMLLGTSGLMRCVDADENPKQLRRLYRLMRHPRPLSAKDWKTFRVRPSNHPVRRIIGVAYILDGTLDTGMAETFAAELLHGSMKNLLTHLEQPPYIGSSRARDILVNVALPFLHAYAVSKGAAALADAALCVYANVPKLQENEITREMRRLIPLSKDVKMNARRQQGLIHLYRTTVHRSHI